LAGGWQQPSPAQQPVAAGLQACPPQVSTLAAQRWPKQLPMQQSLFWVQALPFSAQPSLDAQRWLSQCLVQHWLFFVHGWSLSRQRPSGL
jgi:hypothetical protein